jgi:tetratricopeptide (TPR) repeat protein
MVLRHRQYAIRNFEKILFRFEYWQKELSMDKLLRMNDIDGDQTDDIHSHLSSVERSLGACYLPLLNYEVILAHWDKGASYARKIVKEEKRECELYHALAMKGHCLAHQLKFREAKPLVNEANELVAEPISPRHDYFLRAAELLVNTLMQLEQYEEVAPYARIYYECLTQPGNIESPETVSASAMLAKVVFCLIEKNGPDRNGDIVEAEMLARKAIRIEGRFEGPHLVPDSLLIFLADIIEFKSLS